MMLLLAASISLTADETVRVTDLFLQACVLGEVSLPKSEVSTVTRSDVPAYIRNGFYDDKAAKIYSLTKTRSTYLVVSDYSEPTYRGWVSRCVVYAPINLEVAWEHLYKKVVGQDFSEKLSGNNYQITYPAKGFKIVVSRWRDGKLQLVRFDETTASKMTQSQKVPVLVEAKKTLGGMGD